MAKYRKNSDYPDTPALQDHPAYPKTAYCDDAYSFAALDFVRAQGQNYNKSGQPFFGLLAVQIPHAPFGEIAVLPNWDKAYANDPQFAKLAGQTRQWAAMVTRIDAHFGNILAALEDPNNDGDNSDSIADDTLVIFQSDNGGPGGPNNIELNANGGLRGNKGNIQEGGIRVPLVMRWPAKITADTPFKAGTTNDMVVDVTDLLPTFCELAQVEIPVGVDGVSIAPTLLNSGDQRVREFLIHEAGNGQSIIRGNHKLVLSKKAKPQLYDLSTDRSEAKNIANTLPKLAKELETLLLGERVAEPRGFANTYHHWTGKNGDAASHADNWSNYVYANEGVIYTKDDGAPQLSWTARMENKSGKSNTARGDADLEFLGLEIKGNAKLNASQSLVLAHKVNLTGRNEIRLSPHSQLTVNDGTVSSLRWLDIRPVAKLSGSGTVDAVVYNSGMVEVSGANQPKLNMTRDYHQSPDAKLQLPVAGRKAIALQIKGDAALNGTLAISLAKGFKPIKGTAFTVLVANRITGTFSNANDTVVSDDGSQFSIEYSDCIVTLTAK
jgi:hypothetical protein